MQNGEEIFKILKMSFHDVSLLHLNERNVHWSVFLERMKDITSEQIE